MKAVIQRVSKASVRVNGGDPRETGYGLVILLGIAREDNHSDADWIAGKIASMRIFSDENGKMNKSLTDINGDALVVSQFTLTASTRKGNRPSFNSAAPPAEAVPLYEYFTDLMRHNVPGEVKTGEFGASMQVDLVNEGPVTILLDSRIRE